MREKLGAAVFASPTRTWNACSPLGAASVWLRVEALTISRGYAPPDLTPGGKGFVESLHGIAKLEERDRFAVIGLETDPTTPIRFGLKSVPDTETKFHWRQHQFSRA